MKRFSGSRSALSPRPLLLGAALTTLGAWCAGCSTTFTVPGSPILSDGGGDDGATGPVVTNPDGGGVVGPGSDAAVDAYSPPLSDASSPKPDSGGSSTGTAAWVTVVNGSADIPSLGLCRAIQGKAGLSPVGNLAVLPAGGATGLRWTNGSTHLNTETVSIVAVNLAAIPLSALPGTDCASLVASVTASDGGLLPTYANEVWELGPIGAGSIPDNSAFIVEIEGCYGGDSVNAANCGAGYSSTAPNGNLSLNTFKLDSTPVVEAGVGVQFLQGSTIWQTAAEVASANATAAAFATDGGLANPQEITATAELNLIAPATAVPVMNISSLYFAAEALSNNGHTFSLVLPVAPTIEGLTWGEDDAGTPTVPAGLFANGTNWTFVLVGDPSINVNGTSGVNLAGAHFVVVRNNP